MGKVNGRLKKKEKMEQSKGGGEMRMQGGGNVGDTELYCCEEWQQ